jgi:hypothetical protein
MRRAAFGGGDPVADGPRGIVADVLLMAALEFGDPIEMFVLMKADNFSRQALRLSLRFHDSVSQWKSTS